LWNTEGKKFLDFFSGSGSLNYGHSNPLMKKHILEYIEQDGIINSLDQLTVAKLAFMKKFNKVLLQPRNWNYKMQFCGPTGTNAVEAAIKLARKYTGRDNIIYFEHSFHGVTYGSMSVSGMRNKKLTEDFKKHVVEMPFGNDLASIDILERYLESAKGKELPAAVILETVQAEGGMKVAKTAWLQKVATLTASYGLLLIVDDIQAGCGRTGNFFSFDQTGVRPDIICLSKSLSGYGFPLSVNLLNPNIDCWEPAEHNGTFRGNNVAFIAGTHALSYWENDNLQTNIFSSEALIINFFSSSANLRNLVLKGKGMIRGFEMKTGEDAGRLLKLLFKNGLILDTCGYNNNILKIMPPLIIEREDLLNGLEIIDRSFTELKKNN